MTNTSKTGRTIHVHRDQWHLAWDNSIPPIARIASGEIVAFDLLDAGGGQIGPQSTVETIRTLDFSRVDQVNGPIYVEGATPGDTLEIEFLDLQPTDWGWTAIIPGFGLLADEFPEPALKIWHLEGSAEDANSRAQGWGEFAPGIRIPLAPFCGEIGLAPGTAGPHSTIPPYRHGGNMDTKHITRGTKLYLPVEVNGALFSIGDGHASQGDGEVCGTAIETPMRATVRLSVPSCRGASIRHIRPTHSAHQHRWILRHRRYRPRFAGSGAKRHTPHDRLLTEKQGSITRRSLHAL